MSFKYYEDPILGKGRAQVDTGSGGSSYVGGDRINIAGGTISFVNSADIVNVTGTSVTLQPDTAYKIYATSQAITLNANPPAAGKWAYEGHLEIFTAGTGYVVTGSNVVLANALEPDSVNNCVVRFHDGIAIIAVEDHVAGYIVVSSSGVADGSLPYGITSATQEYIAFDASLNGQTIPLAGAVAEGEKHVVGNGYDNTILTGAVDCGTSKFTVANLGLNNVQVTGGIMTLGDAYIPSGSTVAVSGGGLAVEKVTGAGSDSVIDLGGTSIGGASVNISGVSITGGTSYLFLANYGERLIFSGTSISTEGQYSFVLDRGGFISLDDCEISTSGTYFTFSFGTNGSSTLVLKDTTIGTGAIIRLNDSSTVQIGGTTKLFLINDVGNNGSVRVSSGAIVDLTGNSNPTPIAPGGGITFESGGATILYSSGAASGSYMMDNVTLPAGAKLTNTAVVDLGGTTTGNCYGSVSGATIESGQFRVTSGGVASSTTITSNGDFYVSSACTANNTTVNSMGTLRANSGGTANNDTLNSGGTLRIYNGGVANSTTANDGGRIIVSGGTANEPIISSGGSLVVSSGGTALLVTSNTGANVSVADGGYITYKE